MTVLTHTDARLALAGDPYDDLEQRYRTLLEGHAADSAQWLARQLRRTVAMHDDLPADIDGLDEWATARAAKVAAEHARYLEQRRQGGPRRYFANRSQALWFLQQVAPTKAVDGAWLQGALRHWQDPRYHGLIRTFLEELGDGDARCNHVLIYHRLLGRLGCLDGLPLQSERYLQGALQLALGAQLEQFLPEVLGYNLGYEQPPLHLLITTHELAELGIDAHYFQLHVTIDNAASGHARRAIDSVRQLQPSDAGAAFYRRVREGYRLNDLGLDTASLIESFDLEAELLGVLERKQVFGRFMHSEHCRLQGRTVNQWLAEPGSMPGFLAALQAQGWVKRGENPAHSRLWTLIDGPTAAMFGVFNTYEKQLWHDWIAGDWQGEPARRVFPGQWESQLAIPDEPGGGPDFPDLPSCLQAMAGNGHAQPDGLRATRAYVRLTGLAQGDAH
ncbi:MULTISPECIES: iron-containing redox enzyme family protein [unclassified Pseudomonas]|uniref:iron-containing redox enzyme family protein n=1 Tax=unclassified Pseudomonas TaxID=196821 RepID=UPI002098315C|nr:MULTISPECIES: iron-containing redox enzyme family protein [unclassified Pseudomonas]MCO7518116.1 iron-containing redox enzyme family protein [Pseudomonas sp. 1]MCO7541575.1 iron-containing redox enzyme family protein [Pseudomonas sp. VA159-2]